MLIVDFMKLSYFCGFADLLSKVRKNTRSKDTDIFGSVSLSVVTLLTGWCEKLELSFWASEDAEQWFNVTLWDPLNDKYRKDISETVYKPWQYLHLYLRLWRNCVEHKKQESVAASFAHMRTLPLAIKSTAPDQLDAVKKEL